MSDIKSNINKKSKKISGVILDNYIRRLADTKKEKLDKLVRLISKFDERVVLTKLCSFLEHNTTIDGFRNAHDIIVGYGPKSIGYLEKLYQKPGLRFEVLECIIFALYAIGDKNSSNAKLLELYKTLKDDERYNLLIIIDMYELDLINEAVAASLDFIGRGEGHKIEFISAIFEFFEGRLEVEAWIRKQSDANCRRLMNILDDYAESFENLNVTRDNIEFFKFDDYITADKKTPVEQMIYCYEMSNLVANYIVAFKEENDINFMPYHNIKGFVFLLMNNSVELIETLSGPAFPVLCDMEADASQLFAKDTFKSQYEKLYSFFYSDMKLIYGENITPVNIDYFAWRMLCLTYTTLRDFLRKTPDYHLEKNEDDELFVDFIFGVSEEVTGNVEEYIFCDGGRTVFAVDEITLDYFKDLMKQRQK